MVQISLYLTSATMENDLSSHHITYIRLFVFGRSKIALNTMNPLTNDDSDLTGALVQYNHVHGLFAFRVNDRNRFAIHGIDSKGFTWACPPLYLWVPVYEGILFNIM